MTEVLPHQPFDFSKMPLTVDQKILAALERIEVLLTPKVFEPAKSPLNDPKLTTMPNRAPGGTTKVTRK